jgi:putative membrane protein
MTHTISAVLSALHLLALAIGFGAIAVRAALLRRRLDPDRLRAVFVADNLWGLAAFLWITTGPARAFGPFEKGTQFYVSSTMFHLKIGLFLLILLLEIMPMVGLIKWRIALKRGATPDLSRAGLYSTLSHLEAGVVAAIVFVAAFMARGFGMGQ